MSDDPANDNKTRAEYMREYMARRRHGGKTLKSLLRDGLLVAERAGDDPEARAFSAAVRALLQDEPKAGAK